MSELAITGGPASRSVGKYWPEWPPQSEKALELVTEVVKSGKFCLVYLNPANICIMNTPSKGTPLSNCFCMNSRLLQL